MLPQLTFTGFFRREIEVEATGEWRCPLCSKSNEINTADQSSGCTICNRARSPGWLQLEVSRLQITLGTHVLHTSVGGSESVSIVIAIDYGKKTLTLLRVKKTKPNVGTQQGNVSFHEFVLNASQMQQQLKALDGEHEEDCIIDSYSICGECRGVFHVTQGDPQSQNAFEDKISELRNEMQHLGEQKQRFAKEKAYGKILECTEQLKLTAKKLQVAKRELEFLNPVFCPFCGWSPSQ